MSNPLRIFWLFSLGVFLSGCSGYRTLDFSPSDLEGEGNSNEQNILKHGDDVRLFMDDGESVSGEVVELKADSIILEYPSQESESDDASTEVPHTESQFTMHQREIMNSDIASLERKEFNVTGAVMGVMLVIPLLVWLVREGSSQEAPPLLD